MVTEMQEGVVELGEEGHECDLQELPADSCRGAGPSEVQQTGKTAEEVRATIHRLCLRTFDSETMAITIRVTT